MMVFAYYKCKPLIKVVPLNFVIHPVYDLFSYTLFISSIIVYKSLLDGGTLKDYLSIGMYNLFFPHQGNTHNTTLLVKTWLDANPNEGLFFLTYDVINYSNFSLKCLPFLLLTSTTSPRLLMMPFSKLLDSMPFPIVLQQLF